jgi:hypothetical protein
MDEHNEGNRRSSWTHPETAHPEILAYLQYILYLHKIYCDPHGPIRRHRLIRIVLVAQENDALRMLWVANTVLPSTTQIQLLSSQMTNPIKTKP